MNLLRNMMMRFKGQPRNWAMASDQIYFTYKNMLTAAALSQFEYQRAPDTANMLYFERNLLFAGTSALYQAGDSDVLLSTGYVNETGKRDAYGYPWAITGITAGSNHNRVRAGRFEVCYDNIIYLPGTQPSFSSPTIETIELFAQLLWEGENTFRSNLMHQNKPFILNTNRKTNLSFANFWEMFQDFRPYIMAEKGMDLEGAIDTIDLQVDYIGVQLRQTQQMIFDFAMYALGFPKGTSKTERQIFAETFANSYADGSQLLARYTTRKDFVTRANRTFGLDMQVIVRESPILELNRMMQMRKDVKEDLTDVDVSESV